MKEEMLKVKELGEEIGYGNLMSFASALWRKELSNMNHPILGAFVPRIDENLDQDDVFYDEYVNKLLSNSQKE